MHLARASAINIAPIPLRLVLALTFIWAGLGKVVATFPVQGEQAALLANMGYAFPHTPTPPASPASPTETPTTDPERIEPVESPAATDEQAQPEPSETATDSAPPPSIAHSAVEFPDPVEIRRLYGLALLTYKAAHPAPDAEGVAQPPIWPEWAARDRWPIVIAWAAAVTEIVAGVLVLVGLLTRFFSLAIAGVMATAIWLTEIGPAIQIGDTLLGFLPRHDLWDTNAWRPLLWQLALFGSAVALCFAGPGALALDRAGGGDDDVFDDDEDDDS